jgi:hypothetical protein
MKHNLLFLAASDIGGFCEREVIEVEGKAVVVFEAA